MQRRNFLLQGLIALSLGDLVFSGCTMTGSQSNPETDMAKRQAIDSKVDFAISKLYSTVEGSRELVSKSQGMLVFPSVVQAGFIVGGSYGEGALRVGGHTVGYYSTASGSFGLTAGGQEKTVIFLFMTQESLNDFRNSSGWSVSGDASVALVKVGANGKIDTTTATAPVQVFVMTNAGLMGDLSLAGIKVSRLNI